VKWGYRLKLLRICRRNYIVNAFKVLIDFCSSKLAKQRKLINSIISSCFEIIFWTHLITCIWIKLGSESCDDWESSDPKQTSWLFVEGFDFSGTDNRTIYQ